MNLHIRKVGKSEFYQTENLIREAFWNLYNSGCTDHIILHKLRNSKSYVGELDLVVLCNGDIIGHIISTKAKVLDSKNKEYEVLCVGPFAVSHDFQHKGVGTELLKYHISEAKKLGFKGMVLFGNPNYYHRFGFKNAKEYKITTKEDQNFDQFMVLELQRHNFENVNGRFFEDSAFEVNENELNEFEKRFPTKEKGKPKIDIKLLIT